ncbi:MAG: polysaccharide biosynthesis/export family protein [Flavobacteriales bacterium]|jgi:polysaccharide export outer membrane protein|uniref:polysaccharide biosynthesis/export family protein n=1 Tax=Candidatus Ulvibacter alkanivorans TaxID=2267620 RepID=UPI000DF39C3A|nr:polysaccharide biosynthesis/export family protein [Candidatus Ulvibacter alkanivorans]MCH2489669.1 polysaccharide biosynthesis/export family protein [Flavobacteriales bacterium]
MRFASVLVLLLVMVSFSSCISKKRLTYLQQNETATDSLIPVQKLPDAYRLQVHDLLSIRVKALDPNFVDIFNPVGDANPNATGEERLYYDGFVVNPHGNIRIPILGEIPVLGLTVEEVRENIEKRLLDEYYKAEANIFVTVKLSGIRYTINGEIGRPGSNIIYRDEITIMEAIANSGDITITGDRTDVVLIRQYPLGQKVHHIDLTTIDAMNSPYYYVQPNDLILINPLPQKSLGTGTTGLQSFTTILTVVAALTSTILLFIRL